MFPESLKWDCRAGSLRAEGARVYPREQHNKIRRSIGFPYSDPKRDMWTKDYIWLWIAKQWTGTKWLQTGKKQGSHLRMRKLKKILVIREMAVKMPSSGDAYTWQFSSLTENRKLVPGEREVPLKPFSFGTLVPVAPVPLSRAEEPQL